MWARIAAETPEDRPAAARCEAPAPRWRRRARAWQWAAAAALLAAALLAPQAGKLWTSEKHGGASHATVVREVKELVANTMTPEETRAAWQHILECPGCFELYRQAWQQTRGREDTRAPEGRWRLVSAPRR
jgi:hypothetical protein